MNKKEFYENLNLQLEGLIDSVPYLIANLANASALLYENLENINWAGFYLMERNAEKEFLVLGPFQGKTACIEIPVGKGVCGKAVEQDEIQLVEDVHKFPGHIACDSASNSEIVIPIHKEGKVFGVLDIDSPILNRFDREDAIGLYDFVKIIEKTI